VHRAYEAGRSSCRRGSSAASGRATPTSTGSCDTQTRLVETTVGRALLSEILPEGLDFALINRNMDKKSISATINVCYRRSA
jgi:DNA-directed RNA polymerase subunit beta'